MLHDVFPATTLLGRCADCRHLVFAHQPHEWADPVTNEMRWPADRGAALYCGGCSNLRTFGANPPPERGCHKSGRTRSLAVATIALSKRD